MKKIYTYEYCKNKIKEYKTIEELTKKNWSLLVVVRRNGWKELLSNLDRKIHKKYTYEECVECVSKYEYFNDFYEENKSMRAVIRNNGWEDILKKLKHKGSKYKRCIYVYEFYLDELKYAYVGLTFDLNARDLKHRTDTKSSVYKFSNEKNIKIPFPKQLTNYVDKNEASKLEGEYEKLYAEKGFIMLNKRPTGILGGNPNGIVYTKEYCISIAKKYKTITSFAKDNSRAYQLIRLNNWGEEVFSHMENFDFSLNSPVKKPVEQYNKNGEKVNEYCSIQEASDKTNVRREYISKCCNGHANTAGGFIWKFQKVNNISSIKAYQ